MPSEAEAVHGLSTVFLADKPRFADKVLELLEFIGDCPLVAHNASFDFGFINWELQSCGHPPVCTTRMIDTLAMARTRHPGAKHSLDALCTRYGIDRSHRVKHGALLDAQLLAQLYVELSGGRQIGFTLRAEEAVTATVSRSVFSPISALRRARPPRPHAATLEELARHAAFVSGLIDPLWGASGAAG
jgi:DNA polymerase-3 subunit epsilon